MDKIIDIFQFTNFRKYLDEYQAARVLTDPDFTRAGACVLLGLPKTRSYYNDIVKGKKLSSRMIPKFVEVLGLNKKEARYFETLVNLDQAKTAMERNAFFEELLKQHPDSHRILNEDGFWKSCRESVSSGAYNNSDLVRQYQLQCFELSKQALLANNENPSDMGTFTFSVSDDAFKAIAKEIQGLKARVRKIIAQDRKKATGVHQLNIHLFTNLKK